MNESNITFDSIIQDLLKTDLMKKIICRDGRDFATMLSDWLIRYIIVLSSRYEVGEEDFQEILYYFHGETLWEILELSKIFTKESVEGADNTIMKSRK